MPYIKQEERAPLNEALKPIMAWIADYGLTEGQLNYVITRLCLAVKKKEGLSYKVLNAIIGVLECAKLEFYRRLAVPYENTKLALNGDVV